MTSNPLFTILLPIHRPPDLLGFAIESVLAQECENWELLVICDGAPPATVQAAEDASRRDARVKAFAFAKGGGHGEAHRHTALQQTKGAFICQIADDDLWFPDHLTEMKMLLSEADFGNVLFSVVNEDDTIGVLEGDLGDALTRKAMMTSMVNLFGPTSSGYRREIYNKHPEGWSPAPPDMWSDLNMWRKLMALPDIVCATRRVMTTLHFSAAVRSGMTLTERADENARWLKTIQDPAKRDGMRRRIFPEPV